jgi:hypothetical protein
MAVDPVELKKRSLGLEDALADLRMFYKGSLVEASTAIFTLYQATWQHRPDRFAVYSVAINDTWEELLCLEASW